VGKGEGFVGFGCVMLLNVLYDLFCYYLSVTL